MKINKTMIAACVGVLAFAGVAISQTTSVRKATVVNPTDLFQIIPLGQGRAASTYVNPAQITSQSGYQKYGTGTSGTYTFANSQNYIALNPATTVSSLTIVLAAAPSDGARQCTFSTQAISTLAILANTGQSINNAATSLAANASACYLYSASNLTWDRD